MSLETTYFRTIPKEDISFELAMEYLTHHNFGAWHMQDIPNQYLSDQRFIDLLIAHLKTSTLKLGFDMTISFIPKHLQTYELLTLLVKRSGWNLHGDNINCDLLTPELVNLAVSITPDILDKSYYRHNTFLYDYVSEASLINFVSSNNIRSISPLDSVPDKLKTYNICYNAISTSPYNWAYVPNKYYTKSLILKVLESCAQRNLGYKGAIAKSLARNFMAYLYENHIKLVDNEIILYYYKEIKCKRFSLLPAKYNSPELWSDLIKINPIAYMSTPKEYKTLKFIEELLAYNITPYLSKNHLSIKPI